MVTIDQQTAFSAEVQNAIALRRDLHMHPELMYQEHRTAAKVAEQLSQAKIEHVAGLAGGTGVLGYLPATTTDPSSAETIALRADMDALPILEATGLDYASKTPGVMHACGHDGHTSILVGTARYLSQIERPRNVLFVFQPAEEGGAGGKRMCEDGVLNGSVLGRPVDIIFGLHCAPFLPLGSAASRVGPMMAATDEIHITVRGRGGHAAIPQYTNDPVIASAHVITALQTIASRGVDPLDSVVVTIATVHAGAANNVIPSEVVMSGTVRTLQAETREFAVRRVKEIASTVATAFGCIAEVNHIEGYPVTENNPVAFERAAKSAQSVIGDKWGEYPPVMGGEDFSFYGQHVPACFFWLGTVPEGAEDYAQVHTNKFNFNDDALEIGMKLMSNLALRG